MTTKQFCKKFGITENQFYGKDEIIGDLYLSNNQLTSLPDGFNPTVGGNLFLSYNQLTKLPDGFNPTVGGSLFLSYNRKSLICKHIQLPDNYIFTWQDGKYIMADGIFTDVIEKKGNVYKVRRIGKSEVTYLVTDGKYHAHGETLEKAKEDFRFKKIAEKLKKDPIKADTIINIQYYRIITGACELGVKKWMEQNNITKNEYKAKDLLPLLEKTHAYGLDKFRSLITF